MTAVDETSINEGETRHRAVTFSDGTVEDCSEAELHSMVWKPSNDSKAVRKSSPRAKKRRVDDEEESNDDNDSQEEGTVRHKSVTKSNAHRRNSLEHSSEDGEMKENVAAWKNENHDAETERPPPAKKSKTNTAAAASNKASNAAAASSSAWGSLMWDKGQSTKKKNAKRASAGDGKRTVRAAYCQGDDLPVITQPSKMFDDMISVQLTDNGRNPNVLLPMLQKLHARPLRVATMCSGTESPILALDMLTKSIEDFYHSHKDKFSDIDVNDDVPLLQIEHVFSCEIEPFKQSYIERNFHPPLLFRDIRELGNKQAHTAFGALVDVPNKPGCVDMLVAGTSCVDYSNLNTKKVCRLRSKVVTFLLGDCVSMAHKSCQCYVYTEND